MKHGFLRANWAGIFITVLCIIFAIRILDPIAGIASVMFIFVMINNYMKYDADEQASDSWWLNLDKEERKKIHSSRTAQNTSKESGTNES